MGEVIDFSALTWVKQGLDETLAQARDTLESYVNDPDDVAPLRACIASLHQVKGTLTMMETHAAADLAGEMEATARALLDKKIETPSDAYESIMRAILQLPDYLEWLQSGKQDQPQLLAPLRNDLLKARGVEPSTTVAPAEKAAVKTLPDAAVRKVAQQTRTVFQSGLIGLVKGDLSEEFSKRICISLGNLERACLTPSVNRVWVLASGVLEAVTQGGLETSLSVKKLFGQLDREIKRLSDSGEQALSETPNLELIDALEGLVQTASRGGKKLKSARSLLEDITSPESTSEDAGDLILGDGVGLSGVNTQVLETVSGAVREDLAMIKDSLDIFTRSESRSLDDLEKLRPPLRKIADTIQMIGLKHPHSVILDMCNLIDEVKQGDVILHDQSLLEMATAVLFVESALNGLAEGRKESEGDADEVIESLKRVRHMSPDEKPPVTQSALPDSEFQQVAAAVVREANIDLAQSKDAIVAFIATPFDETILAEIPESYAHIHGALSLLGMSRAANLLDAIKTYIERRLLGNKSLPDRDHLDRLAESISAIEYYLESVTQQRMDTAAILDMAEECLDDLGYPFEDVEAEVENTSDVVTDTGLDLPDLDDLSPKDDPATDATEAPTPPVIESESSSEAGSPEVFSDQAFDGVIPEPDLDSFMPEVQANDTSYSAPSEASIESHQNDENHHDTRATLAAGGLIAAAMGTTESAADSHQTAPNQGATETDHTSEEAERDSTDESVTLESADASTTIDLHTELSSDLESTDAEKGAFDDAARHVLDLHSNEEEEGNDEVPEIDLSGIALESEEDHFAAFQDVPDAATQDITESDDDALATTITSLDDTGTQSLTHDPSDSFLYSSTEGSVEVASDSSSTSKTEPENTGLSAAFTFGLPILDADSDPDILEIFIEEAQEELESINNRLPKWIQDDDSDALGDLRRSYHTLKGSGRMAGAKKLGEYAWAFESLLNSVIEGQTEVDQRLRSLIEEGSGSTLTGLIAQLENQSLPIPEHTDLLCLRAQALKDPQIPYPDVPELIQDNPADTVSAEPSETESLSRVSSDSVEDSANTLTADSSAKEEDSSLLETTGLAIGAIAAGAALTTSLDQGAPDVQAHASMEQESKPVAGGDKEDDSAEPDGIDQVLFGIFSNETYGHLDTLRHFTVEGRQLAQVRREANDDLRRALHTILGSARTAGITEIADLAGPLDQYIKDIHNNNERLSDDDLGLLEDSESVIRNLVDAYPDHSTYSGDIDAILNHISASFSSRTQTRVDNRAARQSEEDEFRAELDGMAPTPEPEPEPDIVSLPNNAASTNEANDSPEPSKPEPASAMFKVEADPDLLEIFLEEGAEILDAAENDLSQLQGDSKNPDALQSLQRGVHTLKGGARMCGISPIGDLSHSLENLFNLLVEGQTETTNQSFDLLTRCFDRLVLMTEQVRTENQVLPADELIAQVDALVTGEPLPAGGDAGTSEPPISSPEPAPEERAQATTDSLESPPGNPGPDTGAEPVPVSAPPAPPEPAPASSSQADLPAPAMERSHQDTVRVRAESMADMINLAGEVSIFRSRLEQQMGSFQFNISELGSTISRIREQLRKLDIETEAQILSRYQAATPDDNAEFDPLELDRFSQLQQLSRALVEGVNDLTSIQNALDSHTREAETLLLQQSRVNTELQEGLMSTRMVPFKGVVPRLARIVRQTSRELDKKVDLNIIGDNEEIDRTILDRMTAPLEHTVRNAISHGIESPAERHTAGKAETGVITLELDREGSEVVIRINDDGRGIDLQKLHNKALDMGLINEADQVPDQDLVQLVLESGVSTANEVSQIAGRGVGMDVVRSEVRQLGGTLDIQTVQGKGTQFTIRLPFTLSMNQALLVEVGDAPYAVPLAALDGVIRLSPEQLAKSYGSDTPLYEYAGNSYKLMQLGALLGINLPMVTDADSKTPILLVRAGDQRIALQVERLIGSREIVVKSLGVQLSSVPGIAGATILGDGSVVLILELGALVRMGVTSHTDKVFEVTEEQERDEPRITVMVVDDSITMRKVATRLLERHNMHVETAKDGLDALAQLQDIVPDVLLLDIEMPRMDGFELASHMRRDDRWKDVPIIMITSRTGDKHRERAMEIGVNHYMGKPYKENDLLNTILKAVGRYDIVGQTHG